MKNIRGLFALVLIVLATALTLPYAAHAALPPYAQAVLADGPIGYWRFNDVPPVATNIGTLGVAADGTYLNGATVGAEAPRPPAFAGLEADNTALQLDGTNDFVRSAQMLLNNLSNVTITGWIRRTGAQRNRTGIWGQDNLVEFGYIDNNTVQLWVDDFATPVNVTTPFSNQVWSYLAVVVDGDARRMTVYTNGLSAGSTPIPTNFYDSFSSTAFFVMGGDTFGGGTNFNGQIDEVALYNKPLSGQRIAEHYFTAVPSPPIITRQPQGTNIFEGADLTLSVEVTGSGPFIYQWFEFGAEMPGQTNSTLVFSNITVFQGASFSVCVTNAVGDVCSADADVIVLPTSPPTITQEPASAIRYAGASVTFAVAATGGIDLDYQWQKNSNNIAGATNVSFTINNVQSGDIADYRAIVSNAAGSTTSAVATLTVILPAAGSYEQMIVTNGPMAFWRFNETNGSTAFDYVGGHHATYVTPAVTGPEAPRAPQFPGFESNNLAVVLDGTNAYVTGPTGLLNGLVNVSVSGWVRRGGPQLDRTGLFGQNDLIEFGYIDNGTVQLWVDNFVPHVDAPNRFSDLAWSYVAYTLNGTDMKVYLDGGLAGVAPLVSPNYGNTTYRFNIGGGGIFDDLGNFFKGQIDEVAVFNKALTTEEICALYRKATGKSVSISSVLGGNIVNDSKPAGTRHDGANFGAVWAASNTDGTPVTRNGVMQFSGADGDQIVLPPHTDFDSPEGAITFWMRSAGTTGPGDYAAILFDRRSGRGDVIAQVDDGTIFVQANDGLGTVNSFATGTTVNNDRWHHIAYVYNQRATGFTTIYIDGVVAGSQAPTRAWTWDPGQQIELGRSHDGFWKRFDGAMDDFRIYSRTLTAAEVGQVIDGDLVDATALKVRFNFEGAPTGVTLSWTCGTLQCTDALIGSGAGTVWADVPNSISPFVVNPIAATNRFYRVRF